MSTTAALQAILAPTPLSTSSQFPPTSRYHGIGTATLQTADGKTTIYLRRRFVPHPERFSLLQEHNVVEGDRLDNLATQFRGDPEQFWRIADANVAIRPEELTERVGGTIAITLPEGIPGAPNA